MIVRNAKRYTGNYFTYDYSVKRPLLRGIDNHIVVAASNIFYKFSIKNMKTTMIFPGKHELERTENNER